MDVVLGSRAAGRVEIRLDLRLRDALHSLLRRLTRLILHENIGNDNNSRLATSSILLFPMGDSVQDDRRLRNTLPVLLRSRYSRLLTRVQ